MAEKEEAKARIRAAEAALERLEELTGEEWVNDDTVERLRGAYGFRIRRFTHDSTRDDGAWNGGHRAISGSGRNCSAERQAVLDLRQEGRISDEVMRRLERDLDLEIARLDVAP